MVFQCIFVISSINFLYGTPLFHIRLIEDKNNVKVGNRLQKKRPPQIN